MKTTNQIVKDGRGALGDVVAYKMNGETYLRRKPGKRTAKPTPGQLQQQERFATAVLYGKQMQGHAEYVTASERNKKRYPSGYTAAVADYTRIPVLKGALQVPLQVDTVSFLVDAVTVARVVVTVTEYAQKPSEVGGGLMPVQVLGSTDAVFDAAIGSWTFDRAAFLAGKTATAGNTLAVSVAITSLSGNTGVYDPNEPGAKVVGCLETTA